jgi:hypothetical protein
MEKSYTASNAGELPTTGGGSSTPSATPAEKPIAPFGPNARDEASAGGAGSDATVNFRCKLTLKNGATLFAGATVGGKVVGGPDDGNRDLILELEGSAIVSGGAALFGGATVGGKVVGGPDESGGGGRQNQSYTRQKYEAAQSGGGSEGA